MLLTVNTYVRTFRLDNIIWFVHLKNIYMKEERGLHQQLQLVRKVVKKDLIAKLMEK